MRVEDIKAAVKQYSECKDNLYVIARNYVKKMACDQELEEARRSFYRILGDSYWYGVGSIAVNDESRVVTMRVVYAFHDHKLDEWITVPFDEIENSKITGLVRWTAFF